MGSSRPSPCRGDLTDSTQRGQFSSSLRATLAGVWDTSARLLRLLSLLQVRRDWSGRQLAERLEVDVRTVRRDVERLRSIGYPVESTPGVAGGEPRGGGGAAPPPPPRAGGAAAAPRPG